MTCAFSVSGGGSEKQRVKSVLRVVSQHSSQF